MANLIVDLDEISSDYVFWCSKAESAVCMLGLSIKKSSRKRSERIFKKFLKKKFREHIVLFQEKLGSPAVHRKQLTANHSLQGQEQFTAKKQK
jgi:hypothetical protein